MKVFVGIVLVLWLCIPAFADNSKVYTDDDLSRYQYGNGDQMGGRDEVNSSSVSSSKSDDKYHWCDISTAANERLKRAQKALIDIGMKDAEVRARYGSRYSGSQAVAATGIEENKAKDEVRAAQDAIRQLEEDATRRNIPPGWLYCNF